MTKPRRMRLSTETTRDITLITDQPPAHQAGGFSLIYRAFKRYWHFSIVKRASPDSLWPSHMTALDIGNSRVRP